MSEKRQQNLFVPLRVRFCSPTEQAQWEHEHAAPALPSYPSTGGDETPVSPIVSLPKGTESPQRTQQIKALIRVCNIISAELGFDAVIQQIDASITTCSG